MSGKLSWLSHLSWLFVPLLFIAALVNVFNHISFNQSIESASRLSQDVTPTPPASPPAVEPEPVVSPVPTLEPGRPPIWASPTPLPLVLPPTCRFSVQNITFAPIADLNKKLLDPLGYVAWSPDGQRLAFSLSRGNINAGWPLTDIALVEANGKNVQSLAPGFMPNWSPSGNLVAYLAYSDDLEELYIRIVDVSNVQVTQVTSIARGGVFPILTWLSDTELLYFQDNLLSFDYKTGQKTRLLEGLTLPPSVSTATTLKYLATNPKQGLVVAASKDIILILKRDEKGFHLLKQLNEGVDNEALAISPDGSALAYVSNTTQQVKIAKTYSDVPAVELPLSSHSTAWAIAWSPDGASLVYVDPDGVHIVNRDGSELRQIEGLPEGVLRLVWSPVGTHMILSQVSGSLSSLPVLTDK